ncbi:MAG TPA: autotransporter-associated beta strand repeat-containing protein, partial [Candidatus Aquilonibacter sp.]|nr:autotransporter-associated beta strand repeat-containing protein [Candidatus Aquilonibacter sp.]
MKTKLHSPSRMHIQPRRQWRSLLMTMLVGAAALVAASRAGAQTVVAHWSFDTSTLMMDGSGNITNVIDSTGNHDASTTPDPKGTFNGTFPSSSASVPGKFGQGLMFNGSDYLTYPELTELMFSNGAPSFTISMWFKNAAPDSHAPYDCLGDWGLSTATVGANQSADPYGFGTKGATNEVEAQFRYGTVDQNARTITIPDNLDDGTWHMLTFTYDTNSLIVTTYVDGSNVNAQAASSGAYHPLANAVSPVGAMGLKGDTVNYLVAGTELDEIWAFTGVLSSNQVENLYTYNSANGPAGPPVTWNGQTNGVNDGNWNVTDTNWLISGVATNFSAGDGTIFNDSLSGTANINLTTALVPTTITVTNNNTNYVFSGTGSLSGPANLVKQGSGTLLIDNSGVNNYTGGNLISAGVVQVGNNDTNGTLPGVVTNNATLIFDRIDTVTEASAITGTGTLAQDGAGTLTLTASNSYTGGTIVNGGTLAFSGAGSINGTTSLALTNGTLVLPISATPSTNIITGTLATGGTTNLISITTVAPGLTYPATIPLIKYNSASGLVNGGNNFLTLGLQISLPGTSGYLANDQVNNAVDLVLNSGPPPLVPIVWSGQANGVNNGNWDILNTSNWVANGSTPYPYQDNSAVSFSDSPAGTPNVNLTTKLSPASMTFNNNTTPYVLSGVGSLGGTNSVTLTGYGSVTLAETGLDTFSGGITLNGSYPYPTLLLDNNPNSTVSGGLTIDNGTVQVGNNDTNGALPAGTITVTAPGALVINRSGTNLNVTAAISGTGNFTNNGTGVVTLSAAEPMTGYIVANAGTLALAAGNTGNSGFYASTSDGYIINTNGTIQVNTDNSLMGSTAGNTVPVTINAGGTLTGLGTFSSGGGTNTGTSSHIRGLLTLNGGTLTDGGSQLIPGFGTWDLDGGVTVNSGPNYGVTSVIGCLDVVPSETGGTTFNVNPGNTPSGIDLLVTGSLINGTSQASTGINITYNVNTGGVMAFDNNNTYTNTTIGYGTTLQLGLPSDTNVWTEPVGGGSVSDNGTLTLAGSQGVVITNVISGGGNLLATSGTNFLTGSNVNYSGNVFVGNST